MFDNGDIAIVQSRNKIGKINSIALKYTANINIKKTEILKRKKQIYSPLLMS